MAKPHQHLSLLMSSNHYLLLKEIIVDKVLEVPIHDHKGRAIDRGKVSINVDIVQLLYAVSRYVLKVLLPYFTPIYLKPFNPI